MPRLHTFYHPILGEIRVRAEVEVTSLTDLSLPVIAKVSPTAIKRFSAGGWLYGLGRFSPVQFRA